MLRCVPMYRGTPCCCFLMVWLFSFFLQQCSRWWQFMEYCSALLCVRHYVWIKEKKNNSLLLLLKESLHYIKGSVLCMLVISSNSWFGALCCPLEMNCRKAFACCLLCSACRREFNMDSLQAINAGEGVEKREPSYTVGGNADWYSHYGKQCGDFLKNWK